MKYNTISTSSLNSEQGKKSTFTIYADMDIRRNTEVEMANTEVEIATIRSELETVQKALRLQTRRCRQLVTEYTRRLQQKEQQYQCEKSLREDQLAKVLRALIIFEARLKQEQKFISHQLKEKDYFIRKQSDEIKRLLASQLCKNCNQFYSPSPNNVESVDSSSEYVVTDYQSSNFESLDSSSDVYTTISENSCDKHDDIKNIYVKHKGKDSLGRRTKKFQHRPSVGTYFEVLKMRNDLTSPGSNEDNTEVALTNQINAVSERIEIALESNKTEEMIKKENVEENKSKISDSISLFEGETNDNNWYASASDQEDDEQRDIYRNNPVLECMNQILLQNINDSMNSPPKTPNIERKTMKKVKFSDEENAALTKENINENNQHENSTHNYYETPIQKIPNFYETPQSIYSNHYEQILSQCNSTSSNENKQEDGKKHFYVDLDSQSEENATKFSNKPTKIQRIPPALPPKPANLVIKYKLNQNNIPEVPPSESEPDYCSISELNLPSTKNNTSFQKISVVAEINSPNSQDVKNKLEKASKQKVESDYDPVVVNDNLTDMVVVRKCVEKLNIQLAKQTTIKSELSPKKPKEQEIPKLPQVSEIIIPEEEENKSEERISNDNYIQNNTQALKMNKNNASTKRSIMMGISVSNLITGFNNQQILSEIKKKPSEIRPKVETKPVFSGFEQNSTKTEEDPAETFDLSQNFEEFKLDDCEIEEYSVSELPDDEDVQIREEDDKEEVCDAKTDISLPSLSATSVEMFKKHLEMRKNAEQSVDEQAKRKSVPHYEHFLECTGLSTKSILTPARLVSNHKSVLKPKDIKLRSRVKSNNNLLDRQTTNNNNNSIKYWSEPYI